MRSETGDPCVTIAILLPDAQTSALDVTPLFELIGGHGEEVVRDVWWETEESARGLSTIKTILTAGEDGSIRLWKTEEAEAETPPGSGTKQHKKRATGESKRYKPY